MTFEDIAVVTLGVCLAVFILVFAKVYWRSCIASSVEMLNKRFGLSGCYKGMTPEKDKTPEELALTKIDSQSVAIREEASVV